MSVPGSIPGNRATTVEEFERLPDVDGYRVELDRGRPVREPVPAPLHGRLALKLGVRLNAFAEQHDLGLTFDAAGFVLSRDPDTVRAPDLSFVSQARLPARGYVGTYWRMAPDLAVEILSPSNRPAEMLRRAAEFINAGSRLVWLIDVQRRKVTAVRPGAELLTLGAEGVLDGGDVLPGFRLPLTELFDSP
jgi:Uma2 family endonuclease